MKRERAVQVLCGLGAFLLFGLSSASLSGRASEVKTARSLSPSGVFNIPWDAADPEILKAWDAAEAAYAVHRTGVDPGPLIPWRRISHARTRGPFLVSVEYGWMREALIGGGGDSWYLCLFGLTLHLGDSVTWQS